MLKTTQHNQKNSKCNTKKNVQIDELITWDVTGKDHPVNTGYEKNEEMNKKIIIITGDITKIQVDVVVNAANSYLRGGGGVDGAIHCAAGYDLYDYLCSHYTYCKTGDFKPSPGFKMPCKEILHGVGPIGENAIQLQSVYVRCLEYVRLKGYKSIAFPCISTGIFGYNNNSACPVVLEVVRNWLEVNPLWEGKIIFCCYNLTDYNIYLKFLPYYFPTTKLDDNEPKNISDELDKEQVKSINTDPEQVTISNSQDTDNDFKQRIDINKRMFYYLDIEDYDLSKEQQKEYIDECFEQFKEKYIEEKKDIEELYEIKKPC
ncbi:macro domain containing protein [Entamoeba histolytica HM-1:IMSS-B]|uniref:Macro domain-containing protein n=6 Tax=Entamoeba histolytica TaxID=5759 RepID=C4M5E0_ENTH1|nr:hypothetical protein, conserved [Entamoeba histolytica HM-1:IMSS]EMD47225.1 macro domain containing protein [Entamoeba histolytica KU27]EMH74204.1 macro domain containing protein [Entamoeba histolytica HM-1:IMSS-B]EMS15277.1 MACRO domain containing protein [Entamoeba histolytica HM-3:IMSS]ENY61469.1 MACRO domain containing protein [Entamoeba histolytica HM-1:IMSS-A]GAT96640.1 hypothetical protein conserved [Entamoeba histolytica]|eukprot:XP_652611.1 hypothetical protein, conserved [Entamoeba histolytica HM-1:IMSS]